MADTVSPGLRRTGVPRLLLTGFEPFGGAAVNPSWEVARSLHGATISMVDLVAAQLPVNWGTAWPTLAALIEQYRPQWVLLLGLGRTAKVVNVETRARNLTNPIRDNAGGLPPPS